MPDAPRSPLHAAPASGCFLSAPGRLDRGRQPLRAAVRHLHDPVGDGLQQVLAPPRGGAADGVARRAGAARLCGSRDRARGGRPRAAPRLHRRPAAAPYHRQPRAALPRLVRANDDLHPPFPPFRRVPPLATDGYWLPKNPKLAGFMRAIVVVVLTSDTHRTTFTQNHKDKLKILS